MILDGKQFTRCKDGTLVAEISELRLSRYPSSFTLQNVPEEGMHRTFRFVDVDLSGDDVVGWRYEEMDGPNKGRSWSQRHPPKEVPVIRVLIIND